jgi:hypothetical protein
MTKFNKSVTKSLWVYNISSVVSVLSFFSDYWHSFHQEVECFSLEFFFTSGWPRSLDFLAAKLYYCVHSFGCVFYQKYHAEWMIFLASVTVGKPARFFRKIHEKYIADFEHKVLYSTSWENVLTKPGIFNSWSRFRGFPTAWLHINQDRNATKLWITG